MQSNDCDSISYLDAGASAKLLPVTVVAASAGAPAKYLDCALVGVAFRCKLEDVATGHMIPFGYLPAKRKHSSVLVFTRRQTGMIFGRLSTDQMRVCCEGNR